MASFKFNNLVGFFWLHKNEISFIFHVRDKLVQNLRISGTFKKLDFLF